MNVFIDRFEILEDTAWPKIEKNGRFVIQDNI